MTPPAYYNEIEPFAAQWLRNLIAAGHIAPGDVDERSIEDVQPDDLKGYIQCHFFAGIGVWSYALRLANWPDDRPVWTMSCPCQPFSSAGKGKGVADERHLWPAGHHLIRERRPSVVLGEQVASRDGFEWFDIVSTDLERDGYAIGAAPMPVAGFGAPHIRMRNYWMAYTHRTKRRAQDNRTAVADQEAGGRLKGPDWLGECGVVSELADPDNHGRGQISSSRCKAEERNLEPCCLVGDTVGAGLERQRRNGNSPLGWPVKDRPAAAPGPVGGFWREADWIYCRDNRYRAVEPGTFPLAHGAPSRVGRLRAYGNAIAAPQACEFIAAAKAFLDLRLI